MPLHTILNRSRIGIIHRVHHHIVTHFLGHASLTHIMAMDIQLTTVAQLALLHPGTFTWLRQGKLIRGTKGICLRPSPSFLEEKNTSGTSHVSEAH